jgi:hypothetical protein
VIVRINEGEHDAELPAGRPAGRHSARGLPAPSVARRQS